MAVQNKTLFKGKMQPVYTGKQGAPTKNGAARTLQVKMRLNKQELSNVDLAALIAADVHSIPKSRADLLIFLAEKFLADRDKISNISKYYANV